MSKHKYLGIILTLSICLIACILFFVILLSRSTIQAFLHLAPQPENQELFRGVRYIREIHTTPRNMIVHVVIIDLHEQGIKLLVTPGDPEKEYPLTAITTSGFLAKHNLQVAINGDAFYPWHSRSILDYYPHNGDPVNVYGMAISNGVLYSQTTDNEPTIYFSKTNRASINNPLNNPFNAISGNAILLKNGNKPQLPPTDPEPRTAIGLNRSNRYLYLVIVDGRQPGYSEGITLDELANYLSSLGVYNAINLDGGGSSTLVAQGKLGTPMLLNSPINHGIPGVERPVGNHLGIYAKPLP